MRIENNSFFEIIREVKVPRKIENLLIFLFGYWFKIPIAIITFSTLLWFVFTASSYSLNFIVYWIFSIFYLPTFLYHQNEEEEK